MIVKDLIKQIVIDQHQNFLRKDPGIQREIIRLIEPKLKLPHIHIITGIRRCGKSTLLRQIAQQFYNDKDFYYLNFEDERFLNFEASQFNDIYEILLEVFGEKKTFFIDEIQHIKDFDAFIRRFYDNNFKFFITGSNAGLLKKEISTRLTGRHIDSYLTPFTFKEYLTFNKIDFTGNDYFVTEKKARIKSSFNQYLINGGMPEFAKYGESEILKNTYDDIIIKDIFYRNKIENIAYAKELYQYLISNFAQKISFNTLQKVIPIGSVNTISKYIHFLEESYLVNVIYKFDFSLKKQIVNDKKLYVSDNGFIQSISTRTGNNSGWLLENLVSNKLLSNKRLFYFFGKKECDFVVMKIESIYLAVQVCWDLNDFNFDREIKGLTEAMNFFGLKEGLLLTYDQEDEKILGDLKIIIYPVWKWLIEQ